MYGQYDTFVTLEFISDSDEYMSFGNKLMGVFLYTLEERQELETILKQSQVPRIDSKTKFSPVTIEKLSPENKELLDRFGIQSSSIRSIYSFNRPRKNRFIEKGIKEMPNQMTIQVPKIDGWQELNRLRFGLLNSIYQTKRPFTPFQEIEYWGLRTHLEIGIDSDDFLLIQKSDEPFLKKIRHIELDCKFHDLSISETEISEFATLIVEKMLLKKEIIDSEIQKSGENIKNVASQFKTEIDELVKCCYSFEEEIMCFGENPIYLTYERFVHIFARHVSETQVGERFSGAKTVFQYKLDDIIYLIKMVVENVSDEIQAHFNDRPREPFRRIGKRSIYIDGHYYRLVIDPNGSIQDFHPCNHNDD